ncbi:MAG: hypothetical protein LBQ66_08225 [Planctomycetaceae bacterium]|nr:hypothetical protein [Planctomycetaceae bacterium]
MKKIYVLFFGVCLLISFTGCDDAGTTSSSDTDETSPVVMNQSIGSMGGVGNGGLDIDTSLDTTGTDTDSTDTDTDSTDTDTGSTTDTDDDSDSSDDGSNLADRLDDAELPGSLLYRLN